MGWMREIELYYNPFTKVVPVFPLICLTRRWGRGNNWEGDIWLTGASRAATWMAACTPLLAGSWGYSSPLAMRRRSDTNMCIYLFTSYSYLPSPMTINHWAHSSVVSVAVHGRRKMCSWHAQSFCIVEPALMQSNLMAYTLDFMAGLTYNVIVSIKLGKCPKGLGFHLSVYFSKKNFCWTLKRATESRNDSACLQWLHLSWCLQI